MRKSATFYDDQYKFYKELKSEKLVIAFREYMFENIEPEWLNSLEKTIFNSLRVRMDNQKKKARAWAVSHWWWRPSKTTQKQQKNNTKTTEQTTKKQEDKDISKDILSISNNIISKDITETKVSEVYGNQDINKLIDLVKEYNWWILDWTVKNSRRYWKLLIDKLNKLEKIQSWEFNRYDTLTIILKVISWNKYYASKITSVESIYRNLSILIQQCKTDLSKQQISNTILPVI